MSHDEEPVLLVEDDPMQAQTISHVIRRYCGRRFSVTRATTLNQAMDILAASRMALVLLDLDLPDSSGLHTLNTVCEEHDDLPIIILTGTDDDALAVDSLKRGAQDYLVKGNFDAPLLARAIRHAIERKRTQLEMKKLHTMLQEERRLEALGAMASGIAHEINTPLQFIGTNIEFIKDVLREQESILSHADNIPKRGPLSAASRRALRPVINDLTGPRMRALREEIPRALKESIDGVKRMKGIIAAMNAFSRRAGPTKIAYDVNRAVRDALVITRHAWKQVATTELYLDDNLPDIPCYPEELSHCLLNLIINAVHAIQDAAPARGERDSAPRGVISVTTRLQGNTVEIRVGDSGSGIPEEIQHRVFEPFFTTKTIGRGSGQGLSTIRQMIVHRLGGDVSFESRKDIGTVFTLSIPIKDTEGSSHEQQAATPHTGGPT